MSHQMVSRKYDPPGKKLRRAMFIFATISLLSAIYLFAIYWFRMELPDKEAMFESQWSTTFGVPVSALAIPVYATMLLMLTCISAQMPQILQWAAWRVLLVCGLLSGMAAAWFLLVGFFLTPQWCIFCFISQLSALFLAGIIWFRGPNRLRRTNPSRTDPVKIHRGVILKLGAASGGAMLLLVIGQLSSLSWPEASSDSLVRTGNSQSADDSKSGGFLAGYDGPSGISSDEAGSSGSIHTTKATMQLPDELTNKPATNGAAAPYDMLRDLNNPADAPRKLADSSDARLLKAEPRVEAVDRPDIRQILRDSAREDGIRRARYMGGALNINVQDHPLIGKADAPHIIAFFVDYTLEECRQRSRYLSEARARYGDQIAIVPIFSPLNPDCNQYVSELPGDEQKSACDMTRLALAVWRAKPEQFEQYHNWLMRPGDLLPVTVAARYAAQLVGQENLEKALDDPWIETRIKRDCTSYQDSGRGYLPKILFEATDFARAAQIPKLPPDSASVIFQQMEQRLRVMPLPGH